MGSGLSEGPTCCDTLALSTTDATELIVSNKCISTNLHRGHTLLSKGSVLNEWRLPPLIWVQSSSACSEAAGWRQHRMQ